MRQSKVPATHDLFIDLAVSQNTQSLLGLGHNKICCNFDVENDHRAYDRRASWKMQICSVIMLCDHIWRLRSELALRALAALRGDAVYGT